MCWFFEDNIFLSKLLKLTFFYINIYENPTTAKAVGLAMQVLVRQAITL